VKTNVHFFIISLSFLLRVRNVSGKSCRENQNTRFVFGNFFFLENLTVYEVMWKIMWSRADHRWQYGACALRTRDLRLQTHTHNM